jgi:hypothetical protein
LDVSSIEKICASKMPNFQSYFESFLQMPDPMPRGHFKYVKIF